jgi:hypothetical protein
MEGLLTPVFAGSTATGQGVVFPCKEWQKAAPEGQGIDPHVLAAVGRLMEKAHATWPGWAGSTQTKATGTESKSSRAPMSSNA